jgi:hypothetical protein
MTYFNVPTPAVGKKRPRGDYGLGAAALVMKDDSRVRTLSLASQIRT